jgi:hypothetical protein
MKVTARRKVVWLSYPGISGSDIPGSASIHAPICHTEDGSSRLPTPPSATCTTSASYFSCGSGVKAPGLRVRPMRPARIRACGATRKKTADRRRPYASAIQRAQAVFDWLCVISGTAWRGHEISAFAGCFDFPRSTHPRSLAVFPPIPHKQSS